MAAPFSVDVTPGCANLSAPRASSLASAWWLTWTESCYPITGAHSYIHSYPQAVLYIGAAITQRSSQQRLWDLLLPHGRWILLMSVGSYNMNKSERFLKELKTAQGLRSHQKIKTTVPPAGEPTDFGEYNCMDCPGANHLGGFFLSGAATHYRETGHRLHMNRSVRIPWSTLQVSYISYLAESKETR